MTADGTSPSAAPYEPGRLDFANNQLTVTGDQNLNLNCNGPINLVASGVNIGAANNAMLLATTTGSTTR